MAPARIRGHPTPTIGVSQTDDADILILSTVVA